MHPAVKELLSIAGDSIITAGPKDDFFDGWGSLGQELAEILHHKNGFYAFQSSLLVRPVRNARAPLGLIEWNTPTLWKNNYLEPPIDALCFAEDIFGVQYCLRKGRIWSFDPEIAAFNDSWADISEWASQLKRDNNPMTGFSLAHAWQSENRSLFPGERLLPKTPFVVGGEYVVDNLYPLDEVKGMHFRAAIANQIHDLPDGAEIKIIIERPC